jgi:hypothetical protein
MEGRSGKAGLSYSEFFTTVLAVESTGWFLKPDGYTG